MLKTLTLIDNVLEPSTWEHIKTEDICASLKERYEVLPETARIYHEQIAESRDVTPIGHEGVLVLEEGIKRLQSLEGQLYAVVYPGTDPGTWLVIGKALAVMVVSMAVSKILAPSVPNAPTTRNQQVQSPNGVLSGRVNTPRLNGRIPSIYGTVWSVPDLLALPYSIFVGNREIEISYLCVGVGAYEIHEAVEGITPVDNISGAGLEVYGPNTSPNSGVPFYTVGDPIAEPVLDIDRSESVNGQVLRAPNENRVDTKNTLVFTWPDTIFCNDSSIDFTDKFEDGDAITIEGAFLNVTPVPLICPESVINLDGTYELLSVTSNTLVLVNPEAENTLWNCLETSGTSTAAVATITTTADRWTDWYTLPNTTKSVYANVVATQGMYADDGSNQTSRSASFKMEVQPIDGDGDNAGALETFMGTVIGSSTDHQVKGVTVKAALITPGRCKVRVMRTTPKDYDFNGVVVDEIQFRDLMSVKSVTQPHFGDITTVLTRTVVNQSALSIKERKLKLLVTRKLPQRISGSTFSSSLHSTRNAADIISAVCLDPRMGRRTPAEVDFDLIYSTVEEVVEYFGTPLAAEFCYTFSEVNISFEETLATIAQAVFCRAYRQASKIKLYFERSTEDSVLLFNHRNKLPGTEARTVYFGPRKDSDGVELTYTDPADDAITSYYIPEDRSAINPETLDIPGVRNIVQSHFHAWRAYNKINYQNVDVEFTATSEAGYLVTGHRILLADNTRPDMQDGEIVSQDGLIVTTSQPTIFETGVDYSIFLQLSDGSVENISCNPGNSEYTIILSHAPALPLSTAEDAYAKTTYYLVAETDNKIKNFLVNEITPQENKSYSVNCSNYDARFYEHDTDFINGLVTE